MEKLDAIRANLEESLATLEEVLDAREEYAKMGDERLNLIVRDSLIQRYEYTFDSFWKFLKRFLEKHYGLTVTPASPRSIFRLANDQKLISDENLTIALDMIEARNETSHKYDNGAAESIAKNIITYYGMMSGVLNKIVAKLSTDQ